MMPLLRRFRIETEDWLRYHPVVREQMGRYFAALVEPRGRPDHQRRLASIGLLCAAARYLRRPREIRQIETRIREHVARFDPLQVDWSAFDKRPDSQRIARTVILKPYIGSREPGVIYIAFESEWLRLLRKVDLRRFAERYTLVLTPSSNPYNVINFVFPAAYPKQLYTLINHDVDMEILPRISPKYRVVPMYPSHWVNPAIYQPRPRTERDIDILMVAACGKVKRHHLLFRALRRMPSSLRVRLMGQDQDGRTAETVRKEASWYGVADRFEILTNVTHEQVRDAFCRAKICILLSLREGSAVVVPEALFANTPMGLLRHAENGSRAFINAQTGRFLTENNLAWQLMDFLAHAESCTPRAWAEANISCQASSTRLNDILKRDALSEGRAWTRDISPMCWQPNPRLLQAEDWHALAAERADISGRFGVELGWQEGT